jgi:methylated-DNA-protein-cysteine methyltransferase-like protein
MRLPSTSPNAKAAVKLTDFSLNVISLVKKIPRGKVATYGQIAALAGKPHGARGVGWILSSSAETHHLPWQRVINSKGRISFSKKTKEFLEQKTLLAREGVKTDNEGRIDLDRFQWRTKGPEKRTAKKPRSMKRPTMFG